MKHVHVYNMAYCMKHVHVYNMANPKLISYEDRQLKILKEFASVILKK